MKKKTFQFLSCIPFVGVVVKVACDPMLGNSLSLSAGLPQRVRDYSVAHPDVFITKRLLKELMNDHKK